MKQTSQKYKAIFFDAGGTLFRPFPSVGGLYASVASLYGSTFEPEKLEIEFQSAWKRRGGLASLGAETNEAKERAWWHSLVGEVFRPFGGVRRFEAFFETLYQSFEKKESWEIFPDVWDTLSYFRENSFVMGIVSNWDLRLERVLSNLGLMDRFDFVVGSSACKSTKPDEKIFREALKRSGTKPSETLYVGDSYEEDFLGAQAVGIDVFLLDRTGQTNTVPKARRVATLTELCDFVSKQFQPAN